MTAEGVDYAWDRPSVAGLVAAGKRFVVRYGGPGSYGKQLDAAECQALLAAGLSIVANAEGTANGLLGGRTAGMAWARSAEEHFRALGMPADRPIYLSVDFDADGSDWPAIDAALRGAAEVIGAGRVGVYGGFDTIAHCAAAGTARWFWQTYAWSAGRWHDRAHLRQYDNHVPLAGGTVDLCKAMVDDYGQWGQGRIDDMANFTDDHAATLVTLGRVLPQLVAQSGYTDGRMEALAAGRDTVRQDLKGAGSPVWAVVQLKALSAKLGGDLVDEQDIARQVVAALGAMDLDAAAEALRAAFGDRVLELAARLAP